MKPLPHQQRIIDLNPSHAILNHEMRTGKSLIGATWVDLPEQGGNTFVITLKKNKKEWQGYKTKAMVLTKEEFKKIAHLIKKPTAFVFDEAHYAAAALFVKGRSQLATAFYTLLKENPECHVLLLTATPIRNNPWSFHSLLCYIGVYIPWKEWRSIFFEQVQLPFLPYPTWMPKQDWRALLEPYRLQYCDIVNLKDVVEHLPPAETRTIQIKQKPYKRPVDEVVTWHHEHKWEQQGKVEEILALGYKKVIVVAYYTEQVDALAKELSKEKPVFILDGRTKDPEAVIKQAQESEECYFVCQSSCGEGWDGWMFSAMVFASMSHSHVSHTQMLGRQRHPKHLRVTETIYLIGGRWDKKIFDTVNAGRDFYESS